MINEYDIVVVGAGIAGLGAAIVAGKMGASVCLIEANMSIGGVLYTCPNMPIGAAFPASFSVGGLIDELIARLKNQKHPSVEIRPCILEEFGPEILYDKNALFEVLYSMLEDAGVHLKLNTRVQHVLSIKNKIMGVSCRQNDKVFDIHGKYFIDCSGDGLISIQAGVPFVQGDGTGAMMGASMTFKMSDVEWVSEEILGNDPYYTSYTEIAIKENRLDPSLKKLYIMKGFEPNTAFFNSVIIGNVNGLEIDSINVATQEARKRCYQVASFVTSTLPGFENAKMTDIGPMIGIRETNHLKGIYTLKGRDLESGEKFKDGVVACDNPVDEVFRDSDEFSHDRIVGKGDYYTIPMRSMIPENIGNLLFAGRHIDADANAFASIRGMSQCMIMGQSCGVLAKKALDQKDTVQSINLNEIVQTLKEQGVNGLKG